MHRLSAGMYFVLLVLTGLSAIGQVADSPKTAIAENPGPPRNPPFFSALTLLFQGRQLEPPLPAPKGQVEQVKWEQSRFILAEPEKGLSSKRVIIVKYDSQGHETERTDEDLYYGGKSITTSIYQDGRLQSRESQSFGKGRPAGTPHWSRWSYDSAGRIKEVRHGSGTALENRYLDYRYDSKGRLVGFAYRQGPNDEPFSHTEIDYNGVLVGVQEIHDKFGWQGSQAKVLDDEGRITDLRYRASQGQIPATGECFTWYLSTTGKAE